ncbi:GyrI-like domain-containing protein [Microbacterium sp. LBN7]|uniref:GyrI-like domain-containing protein n=1 Tax=Microbacterium sp. LBN7 TaxID=3129773 RepID=UPI003255D697
MTNIRITEEPQQWTAGVRERVPATGLTEFFSRAFRDTMSVLQSQNIRPLGAPFAKYYGSPTDTIDVEAGFPVALPIIATGDVKSGTLPAGKVIEAFHTGPYDTLEETYAEIERYMSSANLAPAAVMWEHYLTDPEAEPDPRRWLTRVCWPFVPSDAATEAEDK